MATYEECLDELIALASHAGLLGNESISCNARAYASRDFRLKRAARDAARKATQAEQKLSLARAQFLMNYQGVKR